MPMTVLEFIRLYPGTAQFVAGLPRGTPAYEQDCAWEYCRILGVDPVEVAAAWRRLHADPTDYEQET